MLAMWVFVTLCAGQDAPAQKPFRVTRVEKRVTGDSIRVRVLYEGINIPTVLIGEKLFQPAEPVPLGVVEWNTPNRPRSHAQVTFVLPDRQCRVSLSLDEPDNVMDIPTIRFTLRRGRDIELQPGGQQQISLAFTLAVEGGAGNGTVEPTRAQLLVQSDTENNVIRRFDSFHGSREADVLVDVEESWEEAEGLRRETVVVKSSRGLLVAGVVNVITSVRFSCYDNCLAYHVLDTRTVRFYPQGEPGPFLGDFVGFVHDSPTSTHFSCPVNSTECYITCEAMGDVLTSIDIIKMTSPSGQALGDDVSIVRGSWGSSRLHVPDVSFQDAGEFLCMARSQTQVVTQRLTLGVLQRAVIDRQSSAVTRFENGTMVLTCMANGIPAPTVTFTDYLVRPPREFTQAHVTHPSQSQTRGELTLQDPARFSGSTGVYCKAQNADDTGLSSSAFADIIYFDYY